MRTIVICWLLIAAQVVVFSQNVNTPPPVPVRAMAEWEETGTLLVAWKSYTSILKDIVKAAKTECNVVICCDNQSVVNSAKTVLTNAGVDITTNITFAIIPTSTVWIRDYGPASVYTNNVDSMLLIDWIYNRHGRENDDNQPVKYGIFGNRPVFSTTTAPYDLVNTGGNFMSDGMGTAFASELILRNNDQIANGENSDPNDIFGTTNHTPESIDQVMAEYMGIEKYIKLKELPYDGIHHIDMHLKLLDEETLLVGKYPDNISDGPQIEANIQYITNEFKTSLGRNFKIVRIPMPSFYNTYPPYAGKPGLYPTYANAVFVNKTIIMPKYNNVLDAAAKDTLQKYLPGYTIAQVNCNSMIEAGGAVHCITKEIGVAAPLRIVHGVIRSANISAPNDWVVRAIIQHKSGIDKAELFYATDLSLPWASITMTSDPTNTDNWISNIPIQAAGSTVYYYIQAVANNGKTQVRPITAPEGYWQFKVGQVSAIDWANAAQVSPIFPNPATAITAIPVEMAAKTRGSLILVNPEGQIVQTIFEGEFPVGSSTYFIQANQFQPGTYQVALHTARQQVTQQVVIIGDTQH